MLCSKCRRQTKRRIIGRAVREVCANPSCVLYGVAQGEKTPIPKTEEKNDDTTDKVTSIPQE